MKLANVLARWGKTLLDHLSHYLDKMGQWSKLPYLRWIYAGVIAVAAIILGWSVVRNWEQLSSYNWTWNWHALIIAIVFYCASLFFTVLGWRDIMHSLGTSLPFRKHWKVYTFTNLARRLPTAIWYASGRLLMYEQLNVAKRITSIALVIEIFVVMYAGAMLGSVFAAVAGRSVGWAETRWIYLVLLGGVVFIIRPQWALTLFNKLQRYLNRSSIDITLSWRDMMRWTSIYALNWISGGIMLYWMVCILYPVPFQSMMDVAGIWVLSGVIATIFTTILPVSFGPRELALALLLSHWIPLPVATTVSILSRVWLGINQLIWFGLSWFL